jgi:aminoglycoside phosphotransferase (APT) family kinase protein
VIDLICERLRHIDAAVLRRLPVSGLVLGIDRDPRAKVTLLLFDDLGEVCAVAKVARDDRSEPALEQEYAALCHLACAPIPALRDNVPAPLMLDRVGERLVLVTTAIPGTPMTVGYYTPGHVSDPTAVHRDFDTAGGWLAQFQRATATTSVTLGEELFRDHVKPVLARYRLHVGWSDWEAEAFADLEEETRALPHLPVTLGVVHGDYAIGNILVDRGALAGVIDWELGRLAGVPMVDVLKFAASYSSFLDRAVPPHGEVMPGHPGWRAARQRWQSPSGWPNLTGFMYGFFGEGWYPDLVRTFVGRHAARLGLPPAALPVLMRAFVVEQATALANRTYARGYQDVLHLLHERARGSRCVRGSR